MSLLRQLFFALAGLCLIAPAAALSINPNLLPQPGPRPNTFRVVNPTTNAKLFIALTYPANWNGQSLPAVVLVPGGTNSSEKFMRPPRRMAQTLADQGFVVVTFDPDGRGFSEGSEDYNGFAHQDGLAAIVRFTQSAKGVQSGEIGIVTFSYGITMGAGTLSRHPELGARYLIDWEGPSDRAETGGCGKKNIGHLKAFAACDDENFWREREAKNFITNVKVPYQRLQTERDHVQPDATHALKMINAALQGGNSPHVRLNREDWNKSYTQATLPRLLTEQFDRTMMTELGGYIRELMSRK